MRFADTHGWGYAQFDYVLATDKFTPNGSRSNCRNVMGRSKGMTQTYSGGCQCGKVRYEIQMDIGEVLACN